MGQSLACSFTYVSVTEVNKSVDTEQNFMELHGNITAVILPTLLFAPNCPSERAHQLCSLPDTVHLTGMWREGSLCEAGQQQSSSFQCSDLLSGRAARQDAHGTAPPPL